MKKITNSFSFIVVVAFIVMSCSDILDQTPQDRFSDPVVWSDNQLIDLYLSRIYRNVFHGMSKSNVMGSMTDELVDSRGGVIRPWNQGAMTPDNFGPDRGEQSWNRGYSQIHKINLALDKLDEYARKLEIPKNKLIEKALRLYLDHLKRVAYVKSYSQSTL